MNLPRALHGKYPDYFKYRANFELATGSCTVYIHTAYIRQNGTVHQMKFQSIQSQSPQTNEEDLKNEFAKSTSTVTSGSFQVLGQL